MTNLDESSASVSRWPAGTGMVYFGMSPWQGMRKSRYQLMTRFSVDMPVLYVEPWVGLRSLRTGKTRRGRVLTDIGLGTERHAPNVAVFPAKAHLAVSQSPRLAAITRRRWLRAVERAMRDAGIHRPIVWVSKPEMQFIVDHFDNAFTIYHVVDEYGGYTGLQQEQRDALARTEARLLDQVDLVIVASPELQAAKQGQGRTLLVLENGVEPVEYANARNQQAEPADLAGIPQPRLGYSGLIGKRLDLDLLRATAEHRPDCSLVLIGKVDTRECEAELADLESLPNVYLLGEKPGDKVASYVVGFDVGLLPYAINLETRHISPIKMYEYWAAGAPVLSTAIPAAQRHDFAVHVAESHAAFLESLDALLLRETAEESQRLIAIAAQNSWQARVDKVSAELRTMMGDD
jgi:glycosyltransferase involved in cell wall biosynthesis